MKYDCFIGFDTKEDFWFIVSNNEEKITSSLTTVNNEIDDYLMKFPLYNKLHEKNTFETNEEFENYGKIEGKIMFGVNTIDSLKNLEKKPIEIDGKIEGFWEENDRKASCWVALKRFDLLGGWLDGENLEIGEGSVVKFGGNQVCLKVVGMKDIEEKGNN